MNKINLPNTESEVLNTDEFSRLQAMAFNEELNAVKCDPRFVEFVEATAEGLVHTRRMADAQKTVPKLEKTASMQLKDIASERSEGRIISTVVSATEKMGYTSKITKALGIVSIALIALWGISKGYVVSEVQADATTVPSVVEEATEAPKHPNP